MSRVGKHPVVVPSGVTVEVGDGFISVQGAKGKLTRVLSGMVDVLYVDGAIHVKPKNQDTESRSMWGTTRRFVNNMVIGVTEGFKKVLEIQGVGFKAAVVPNSGMLRLSLGYSHDILYMPCEGVELKCLPGNKVEVLGPDIEKVGQTAAEIRKFRKPEPFKGKGIRYQGEYIRRKAGKKK